MTVRVVALSIVVASVLLPAGGPALVQEEGDLREWNHRIRREKFDRVLPEVMRKNDVDMWIHVMREASWIHSEPRTWGVLPACLSSPTAAASGSSARFSAVDGEIPMRQKRGA